MDIRELKKELEALHGAAFSWALSCCAYEASEAEDVLQTTYLKIMDGRARFSGRSTVKTWLFAVIRRTAAQRRRRQAVRQRLGLKELRASEGSAPANTPEQQTEARRQQERVRAALATLPARQREVLELVFYHELTVREAAGVMGVGLGTARIHYARGKQALLARLGGENER